MRDRTHFFLSLERIQQDTAQVGQTRRGLYPDKDGAFDVPFRENMVVAKITHQVHPQQLPVRALRLQRQQPALRHQPAIARPRIWGDSQNKFHSANANLNSVLGNGKVNEFVFQYSYFNNQIGEARPCPRRPSPTA